MAAKFQEEVLGFFSKAAPKEVEELKQTYCLILNSVQRVEDMDLGSYNCILPSLT